MERAILHSDMNSCYANIELLHHPELRGTPLAVGGDVEARHGIILAKDELAKKAGVKTGMALWQARQLCPKINILPPRMDLYLRFSRMINEIYGDYTDQIERFGLDESWLDVTQSGTLGTGESIAEEIRQRVKFELGVTVSIGVSWNKTFAKLGSDYKKPDAVTAFTRENYREKIWPLPVSDLLYVGPATQVKLASRGIHTIGELAAIPPDFLQSWLGKCGLVLHSFANGLDVTPVASAGDEAVIKSVGNSTTTPRDLTCDEDASAVFWMLCESVAARLREGGFLCRTVQIGLRDNGLHCIERQLKLAEPTDLAAELHGAAMSLLRGSCRWQTPLRSIGVRGADLSAAAAPRQLSLFQDEAQRARQGRLERTVEELRRRFGHAAIGRAALLMDPSLGNIDPKNDHTIHPIGYFKPQ